MLPQRRISMVGILAGLLFVLLPAVNVNAADTMIPIITHIDEILNANPIEAGQKVRMIKIAEDDTITLFVVRSVEGFALKPHLHKTHDESVFVIRGTGEMLINDKLVDIKPGSLHYNSIGKVHSIKQTGKEELVIISIFTPALKEADRHFVP